MDKLVHDPGILAENTTWMKQETCCPIRPRVNMYYTRMIGVDTEGSRLNASWSPPLSAFPLKERPYLHLSSGLRQPSAAIGRLTRRQGGILPVLPRAIPTPPLSLTGISEYSILRPNSALMVGHGF
jgi:hypothetical protein